MAQQLFMSSWGQGPPPQYGQAFMQHLLRAASGTDATPQGQQVGPAKSLSAYLLLVPACQEGPAWLLHSPMSATGPQAQAAHKVLKQSPLNGKHIGRLPVYGSCALGGSIIVLSINVH